MNIPRLQAHLQHIIDKKPQPRSGYEEVILLDAIEQCNQTCLDFMETFDLDKVDHKTIQEIKGEYLRRLYQFHKAELDRIHDRIIENDNETKRM